MDTLPLEIIEQIFCFLSNPSLCSSSLVCKSWNTIVSPLLYGNVILPFIEDSSLFINTIYSTNQTHSINTLVKEIHFLENSWHYWSYPYNDGSFDLADSFRVLPNLQTIIGYNLVGVSNVFDPDFKGKELIMNPRTQCDYERMTMITNNKNNINGITIIARQDSSFRRYSGVVEYLQSFPQITYLIVDYKAPNNTNDIFLQILENCTNLHHLYYGGLNTDHLFETTVYKEYPSIRQLTLSVIDLTPNHIKYIKNTFTRIEKLKLVILDTVYNRVAANDLMDTFKVLRELKWEIYACTLEDARSVLNVFLSHQYIDSTNAIYWHGDNVSKKTKLNFDLRSGNNMSYSETDIYSSKSSLFDIFEVHDGSVNKLTIENYPEIINLNMVNQTFSHLKRLELIHTSMSTYYNDTPSSNSSLLALTIPSLCMKKENLEVLYRMYPSLDYLKVDRTLWDIPQNDFTDGVYTMINRWPNLRDFRISSVDTPSYVKNIVITRVIDNNISGGWIYNTEEKILKKKAEEDDLQLIERPYILLESQSIIKVYLEKSRYFLY